MNTTLKELRDAGASKGRYRHLCESLGCAKAWGDKPISIETILETNGFEDAEWAITKCPSLKPLDDEYAAKRKPLDDEYWAKRKPLDDEYEAKCKPLYDEYLAKCKPLDDEYEAKRKPLYDEYAAKLKTLDDEYEAKRKPLYDEYAAKREALLREVIKENGPPQVKKRTRQRRATSNE